MPHDSPQRLSGPLAAVAGWLLPGAGYWLLGQRARALTVGTTIIGLFLLGVLIAGIRVVDAPDLAGGTPTAQRQTVVQRVLDKPWFIGQVLTGPLGIASAWCASRAAANPATASIKSHARIAEIGTLYTSVAGMLNLMVILDVAVRAFPAREEAAP